MKDNGGPAFSRPYSKMKDYFDPREEEAQEGMSLRDYFAGQALVGFLPTYAREGGISYAAAATWAYNIADAMIAERAKG